MSVSPGLTPVARCRLRHANASPGHLQLCPIAESEKAELEAKGFYQEQYRELRKQFSDWNDGVWHHRWTLAKGVCALCASTAPGIAVNMTLLCLSCLEEYPNTAWHPTGTARPRAKVFLWHAANCDQHSLN